MAIKFSMAMKREPSEADPVGFYELHGEYEINDDAAVVAMFTGVKEAYKKYKAESGLPVPVVILTPVVE